MPIDETSSNAYSNLTTAAAKLREARQVVATRKLLAWVECRIIGEAFAGIPQSQHKQAKREFSGEARITPRSIDTHIRIHRLTQDLDLPDEALSILQFSTVRAIVEEYGDEQAKQIIVDIHDGDLSLMQARVKAVREQIRDAKAGRRQPTLIQALTEALGEVGRRAPAELNEAERYQARTALDSLIEPQTTLTEGDT